MPAGSPGPWRERCHTHRMPSCRDRCLQVQPGLWKRGGPWWCFCLTHTSFNCTAPSVPAGSRAHLGPRSSSAHGPAERRALALGATLSPWRPDAPSPLHLHGVLGSVLIQDLSAGPTLGASPALSHVSAKPPSKEVQPSPPRGEEPRLGGRSCWTAGLTGAETGL